VKQAPPRQSCEARNVQWRRLRPWWRARRPRGRGSGAVPPTAGGGDPADEAAPAPPEPERRLPAFFTYLDAAVEVPTAGGDHLVSPLDLMTANGKKPGGQIGTLLTHRSEKNLYALIENRDNKEARVAAIWESFGFIKITKSEKRAPGAQGGPAAKKAEKLIEELGTLFSRLSKEMRGARAVFHGGDAAGGGAPLRTRPYPLSEAEAREVLRCANVDGKARGVEAVLKNTPLKDTDATRLGILCSLAVVEAPPPPEPEPVPTALAPEDAPPPAPVKLPDQDVDMDFLTDICKTYYAAYDKADVTSAHNLTPSQEAPFWCLFTHAVSYTWASRWHALLDHPQLDAQRCEQESDGVRETPRHRGTAAFNLLRTEPRMTAMMAQAAATVFAACPAEFTDVIVPSAHASTGADVTQFFESELMRLPQVSEDVLHAVIMDQSRAITPILVNYIESGSLEHKPPPDFVTGFRDGRPRAMMVWVMYCLEILAGGASGSCLSEVIMKDTEPGVRPGENGRPPPMQQPRSNRKRPAQQAGGRRQQSARRQGADDGDADRDGDDDEGEGHTTEDVLQQLVAAIPSSSVWERLVGAVSGAPPPGNGAGDSAAEADLWAKLKKLNAAMAGMLEAAGGQVMNMSLAQSHAYEKLGVKRDKVMRMLGLLDSSSEEDTL
jgi:hypothetical protein